MRLALGTGLTIALAAIAGLVLAQDRPAPNALTRGELPGIQSVALETVARSGGREALLIVGADAAPDLPSSFDYPYDGGTVTVNDLGRDGDRRAGDGVYTGRIRFDVARFEREVRTNFARLATRNLAFAPTRSTRFDPVGTTRPAPAGLRGAHFAGREAVERAVAERAAGERAFRETALREARAAVAAFALPIERRPVEILRIDRVNGDVRAELFNRRVPFDIFHVATVAPSDINPSRSLAITDLQVVNDPTRTFDLCQQSGNPNGVWTFKHLVTQMANTAQTGITPEQFAWNWLTLSDFTQEDNNFLAGARPGYVTFVRDRWLAQSGGVTLDLNKAPFRLLAIVSRTDLGGSVGGYGGGSAGEARFVFGVLDPNNPCAGSPPQSTVIFEYGIQRPTCSAKKAWIQAWFDLSNTGLGMGSGSAYNQQLQALTQQFVMAGTNPSQLPNRNSISQLRTNDLIGGPWTLFEYRLRPTGQMNAGNLDLVTVKQTPDNSFRQTPARIAMLGNYISANQAALLNNSHVVPPALPGGHPFLGAEAPTANNTAFTWTNTAFPGPVNPQALTNFSVATCNGCHTGDTATVFTHIKPRVIGVPALLSAFMSDPGNPIEDDLERRQRFMANALNSSCMFFPIASTLSAAFVH